MKDCFSDIHAFGAGYKTAKGYSKVDFDAPGASVVNEVKSQKKKKKSQDHGSNVMDHTSTTDAKKKKKKTKCHSNNNSKISRKPIIVTHFMKILS